MLKAISLVKRNPAMSRIEFAAFWLDSFAPVAALLPKLLGYTVNVTSDESSAQEWDGFAELWFESRHDFEAAFAEPKINIDLDRLRHEFVSHYEMYLVSEESIVDVRQRA